MTSTDRTESTRQLPRRIWVKFDEPTSMGPVVSDWEPGSEREFRAAGWFLYRLTEAGVGPGDGGPDELALDVTAGARALRDAMVSRASEGVVGTPEEYTRIVLNAARPRGSA